jgi:hypothetical protein
MRRFLSALLPPVLVAVSLLAIPSSGRESVVPPAGVTIAGVDAHDGMVYQEAGTYYLIGTAYGCGFTWQVNGTPFCGFHVYSAPALAGPWTYVRELFNRAVNSPFHNQTWASLCGDQGRGCFNPRMVKRPSDGKWILSFNAPGDLAKWGANGYYFMGCDSIAGPCGNGSVTGSTVKPALYLCNGAEDFSIVEDGPTAYMLCVDRDRKLRLEKLDACWCNGIGVGAIGLAGLQFVEGEDLYQLGDGTWVLVFGSNCPYCAGVDTSYATASTVLGPYTVPQFGRRELSSASCGGQSRTVTQVPDGDFVWLDIWYGLSNPNAQIRLEPLTRTSAALHQTATGVPWTTPAWEPFACA